MTSLDAARETIGESAAARRMSYRDVKTLGLSALGGTLEFYDFVIYVYFSIIIAKLFFPPEMSEWLRTLETFGIFAVGYLARPVGGVLMAHFGDLIGRKRMFALSIFLMALPCLAIGLLPSYSSIGVFAPLLLLFFRILQGAAIGGEVPCGWVFVSEHAPPNRIGLATSILSSGIMVGAGLGSAVAYGLHYYYSPTEILDFAWRIAFILGGVFGLIAVFLRRWLTETPVFEEIRARGELAKELPLRTVLREHRPAVAVLMIFVWVFSAIVIIVSLMTPSILQSRFHFDAVTAFKASSFATLIMGMGYIAGGMSYDKFGTKVLFFWGPMVSISYWVFFAGLNAYPEMLYPLYAFAAFGTAGVIGVIPPLTVVSFPPAVRFSGFSFSYNVSYAIFGSVTPLIAVTSMRYFELGPTYYIAMMGLLATAIGVFLVSRSAQMAAPRIIALHKLESNLDQSLS